MADEGVGPSNASPPPSLQFKIQNSKARKNSALHEVPVTQIRPDRKDTPVRTQVETASRLNLFFFFRSTV